MQMQMQMYAFIKLKSTEAVSLLKCQVAQIFEEVLNVFSWQLLLRAISLRTSSILARSS